MSLLPTEWGSESPEEEARIDAEIDRVCAGITLVIPIHIAICLVSEAVANDRTPEYVALRLLKEWGDKRSIQAFALEAAFKKSEAARSVEKPSRGQTERELENELADQLRLRGFDVGTQVDTGAGVADIVIYSEGMPVGVIEVKLAFGGWRQAHQAFGQAKAYAAALKAKKAWVAAPNTNHKLMSKKAPHILEWERAAENVHKALGGLTVVANQ